MPNRGGRAPKKVLTYGDAGGADEEGVCFLEEGVVDEADGEFGQEGGEFEEDLVEPEELEEVRAR